MPGDGDAGATSCVGNHISTSTSHEAGGTIDRYACGEADDDVFQPFVICAVISHREAPIHCGPRQVVLCIKSKGGACDASIVRASPEERLLRGAGLIQFLHRDAVAQSL